VAERYRVGWEPDARQDVLEIVHFIAADSPVAAKRVAQRIFKSASSLSHQPHRGRRVSELAALEEFANLATDFDLRELIVMPWRAVYVIDRHDVRITAIVDTRRDAVDWFERNIVRFDIEGE
jgi:toxin ParE1/3/4